MRIRSLSRGFGVLASALTFGGGCSESLTENTTHGVQTVASVSKIPPVVSIDEEYAEISEHAPGFGGLFSDVENTKFIVFVTDRSDRSAVRQEVESYITRNGLPPDRPIEFVIGSFDFQQLHLWRQQLDRAASGLRTISDIDETSNSIILGARDAQAAIDLAGLAATLGIPSAAVQVRLMPLPSDDNLSGTIRPMVGGIKIQSSTTDICTLGYIALEESNGVIDYNGPRYILTASHCTTTVGVDQNDLLGQPTHSAIVGVEFSDPPLRNSSSIPACPYSYNFCRTSDAALYLLTDNTNALSTFDAVATASGTNFTGTATYSGRQTGQWANMPVSKIGISTGHTSGTLVNTCVNVTLPDRELVCQQHATYSSATGDSGGPVWYTDPANRRWILGIHSGQSFGNARFSFWMQAVNEITNDNIQKTGQFWGPALSAGPNN